MNVLLGITGGIAAYKAPDLVRRLRERGADVRVVMTSNASQFVTATTLQAVSGYPVRDSLWDDDAEAAMGHIELARWADTVLVAPATADFLSRLAQGAADDLLSTLCLATRAAIVVAPAMNHVMWTSAAVTANCERLAERGVRIIGPAEGEQACGEWGPGRMLEPVEIAERICGAPGPLAGRRVLITAGPTREALDPVRYLTNHSSGKMGYALAEAARDAGAKVVLLSGPVSLAAPRGVERIDIESAEGLRDEALARAVDADIFIAAAAVADYRPADVAPGKIKKTGETLSLDFVRTPDVLAEVAALPDAPFTVGFAAETDDVIDNARTKLERKKLDMIVANEVGGGKAFGTDDNAVHAIWAGGDRAWPKAPKREIARGLVELIAERFSHDGSVARLEPRRAGKS